MDMEKEGKSRRIFSAPQGSYIEPTARFLYLFDLSQHLAGERRAASCQIPDPSQDGSRARGVLLRDACMRRRNQTRKGIDKYDRHAWAVGQVPTGALNEIQARAAELRASSGGGR